MARGHSILVMVLESCLLYLLTTVHYAGCETCGGIVNKTEGNLTSPGFPGWSTPNTTCIWYLLKDSATFMMFHLDMLQYPGPDTMLGPDSFLVIYNGNATVAEFGYDIDSDVEDVEAVANFTCGSVLRTVLTTSDVTTVLFYSGEPKPQDLKTRFHLHFSSASDCQENERMLRAATFRSPLYPVTALPLHCIYMFQTQDPLEPLAVSFTEFAVSEGQLLVKQDNSTLANLTGSRIPDDVFTKQNNLALEFMYTNSSKEQQKFTAIIYSVNPGCLQNITLTKWGQPVQLTLPVNVTPPIICQWYITVAANKTGLVRVSKIASLSNRVLVSDGGSLYGSGDVKNTGYTTTDSVYIGSGRAMSVLLLALSTRMPGDKLSSLQTTLQKYGGIFYNNGSLEGQGVTFDGSSSWYYFLIVSEGQKVEFQVTDRLFFPATSLKCYDGGREDQRLLADFRSDRPFYPVVSSGNRMLVVASNLEQRGFFNATFTGTTESCNMVSQGSAGQYVATVTESGKETCNWIILPQNKPHSIFMIKVQAVGLLNQDIITIYRGLSQNDFTMLTARGDHSQSQINLPRIIVPSSTGVRMTYSTMENGNQTTTRTVSANFWLHPEKICGGTLNSAVNGNLLSSYFPEERYPLNMLCEWSTTVTAKKVLYMTFNTFQINPRHSLTITESVNDTYQFKSITDSFNGTINPGDLLLSGPTVNITFSTQGIHHGLDSGQGFNISYRSLDCGGVVSSEDGQFSSPGYPKKVITNTECIWIVCLPPDQENGTAVNIVSFTIHLQGYTNNSKNNILEIRDGNSQQSPVANLKLTNGKSATLLSRTNHLWIRYVYEQPDSSTDSPGFAFEINYKQHGCSRSQQCDNGVCLHPNWRCNGVDNCGDMTDESDCVGTTQTSGVAGYVVAICVILAFALGIGSAFIIPMIYKRCRYPNYSHLRDIVSPVV